MLDINQALGDFESSTKIIFLQIKQKIIKYYRGFASLNKDQKQQLITLIKEEKMNYFNKDINFNPIKDSFKKIPNSPYTCFVLKMVLLCHPLILIPSITNFMG